MSAERRYELYVSYCTRIGVKPADFAIWMQVNDEIAERVG